MTSQAPQRITVVDDEPSILEVMRRHLDEKGYEVLTYTEPKRAIEELSAWKPNLVITDLRMTEMNGIDVIRAVKAFDPETNVIMMTAFASVDSAIQAIRNGAIDYIIKPFKLDSLDTAIQRALNETRLVPSLNSKDSDFPDRYKVRNLIGSSSRMQRIYDLVKKSAKTSATVLITGESGTGKELVARAIHYNSRRKNQPFVGINCAALPETLLESELFGYEKGSFTGAVATKMGLIELAHKGTFFLDEIGEVPLPVQVKLLRVLQEKILRRVGGLKDITIDVRTIAATNRDLARAANDGTFRSELFYRLNVIPISLPPLRDRKEDIPKLTQYFISIFTKKMELEHQPEITKAAMTTLEEYHWPGNVRELENVIERILALSEGGSIDRKEVEEALSTEMKGLAQRTPSEVESKGDQPLKKVMDDYEMKLIVQALESHYGNKLRAAEQLGLTRQSLQYKLKKYGLM